MIGIWKNMFAPAPIAKPNNYQGRDDWDGVRISREPEMVQMNGENKEVPYLKVKIIKATKAYIDGKMRSFEVGEEAFLPFGKTSRTDLGQTFITERWAKLIKEDTEGVHVEKPVAIVESVPEQPESEGTDPEEPTEEKDVPPLAHQPKKERRVKKPKSEMLADIRAKLAKQ